MNIDYFNEFLVLAECLNFRRAARKLFISQSALSRHMEALEQHLQTRLFSRTTQTVELTETGRLLQLRARNLVDDYEDIRSQVLNIESLSSGTLRVGVPYYSAEDYLGMVPGTFKQTYPDIHVEYFVDTPTDVYNNLINRKTDIAFLAGYEETSEGNIRFIPVYRERLGVIMNSMNPLAEKEYLSFTDLKNETFLFLNDPFFKNTLSVQINKLARKLGNFTINRIDNYDRMESMLIGVAKNDGISVSGELLRSQESQFISYRPLTGKSCSRPVCICYEKDNNNSSIQKFIDLYKSSPWYRIENDQ